MAPYVRKVKTSSGATAVQIVEKRSGVRRIVEHLGSAHDDLELALLLQAARDKLAVGQDELDLGLPPAPVGGAPAARVVSSSSRLLWQVLADAYAHLGFDVLADEAFQSLVLARLIEPTSKADTVRVLQEIGAPAPHVNTLHAAMRRTRDRDYRGRLATACMSHSAATAGTGVLILYDVTVRHEALVVRMEVRDHHRGRCRSRGREAEGSLTGETPGRAGAALTKPCHVSTVRWRGRGERAGEAYARNRRDHLS